MKNTFLALVVAVFCCLQCWSVAESLAEPPVQQSTDASMNTHLKIGTDGTITVTHLFKNFPNRWRCYFSNAYISNAPFSMDNDMPGIVGAQLD